MHGKIAGLSKQPSLHGCVLIVEPFMLQEVKKSNVALKKFKRVTKDLLEEVGSTSRSPEQATRPLSCQIICLFVPSLISLTIQLM